jgi:hypothetical protein
MKTKPPPVNPNVNEIADEAKYRFAVATRALSETQYRLAELAGLGSLDRDESISLQDLLFEIWEHVYLGTLEAVRDEDGSYEDDNTYSDGRAVRTVVRADPQREADWEHNRFLLGDGAVAEHPRGTVFYIAPVKAIDDADDAS